MTEQPAHISFSTEITGTEGHRCLLFTPWKHSNRRLL